MIKTWSESNLVTSLMVDDIHVCEHLAKSSYIKVKRPWVEPGNIPIASPMSIIITPPRLN